MHQTRSTGRKLSAQLGFLLVVMGITTPALFAQTTNPVPVLQIKADRVTARSARRFTG